MTQKIDTTGQQTASVLRCMFVRYVAVLTAMSLAWEFAQMPLYTLWAEGTAGEILYAGLHCTVGDALIGGTALFLALLLFGPTGWPRYGKTRVLVATVVVGVTYTIFSEWLNVEVRGSWAYSPLMPTVPFLGTGLTALVQWLILPVAAYHLAIGEVARGARQVA